MSKIISLPKSQIFAFCVHFLAFIFLYLCPAFLFLSAIFLSGCDDKKQQKKVANPLPSVISYENIDEQCTNPETQIIDTLVNSFLKQWAITGATLAICKDGKLIYAKGFGYADKENNQKMRANTLLRIASVSKLFTAVGIMRLVEDGDLTLESKVFGKNGILNEYDHLIADSLARDINIEHLLTHTAGWRNQLRTDPMFAPVAVAQALRVPSPVSFEQTIGFMLSQKGYFKAGTFVDYSNFGYCILGKVIEKISKKSYENYIRENILKPIGITEMRIGKNRLKDRFPKETRYYDQPNAPKVPSIYNPQEMALRVYEGNNTENLGASGGWIASVIDLVKFACAIDGFEHFPDFLSKESINRMTSGEKNLSPKEKIKISEIKNQLQTQLRNELKNELKDELRNEILAQDFQKDSLIIQEKTQEKTDTNQQLFLSENALETPKIINYRVLGWKSVDGEKWWRTGNLSSTSSDLTRRHDGYTFAFITNTGSWRGPYFPYEIQGLMRKIFVQAKNMPAKDLF